jgi:hypothetical protein
MDEDSIDNALLEGVAADATLKILQGMIYHAVQPIDPATASATLAVIGRQFEEAKTPEEARKRICEYFWVLRQLIWTSVQPESCAVIARMIEMFVDLNRGTVPMAFKPSQKEGEKRGTKRKPIEYYYFVAITSAALDSMLEADYPEDEAYRLIANEAGVRRDRKEEDRKTTLVNWRYKVQSGAFGNAVQSFYHQVKASILHCAQLEVGEGKKASSNTVRAYALHLMRGEFKKLHNSPFSK